MTIRCPKCGHEEPDGERFCGQCGNRLDGWGDCRSSEWEDSYYYSYEWFGEQHRIKKWKWDLGIASYVVMGVAGGLWYLALGLWANALIFFSTMCIAAALTHIIGKREYEVAALFAVGFLVVLPGVLLSAFPWQAWHEDYLEDKYAPRFYDDISYYVVDGTHVICDGNVTNYGRTGARAVVEFKAYSGPSDDLPTYIPDIETGSVVTEWIAPDGGVAHVHWECYLDYISWGGYVTWTIEPQE